MISELDISCEAVVTVEFLIIYVLAIALILKFWYEEDKKYERNVDETEDESNGRPV